MSEAPSAKTCGAILLAAGGSTRMGSPKQLLSVDGLPLIARTIDALLGSSATPIIAVVGGTAAEVRTAMGIRPVKCIENHRWAEGIGTSIQTGLQSLLEHASSIDAVVVSLGDQPNLSSAAVDRLITAFKHTGKITASRYRETVGAPAVFPKKYFSELLKLGPAEGAQRIIKANLADVEAVDLPELAVDLDTPDDYQRFLASRPTA